MYAKDWLNNAHNLMQEIEEKSFDDIKKAAELMADAIASGHWVHTWGCGHATIPCEEMYPRIGGIVGFHPLCELPMTFFTQIIGEMGISQFMWLERQEGYAAQVMKNYEFSDKDVMWIFSHTGVNACNIDMAMEAHKRGMKVIAYGSAGFTGDTPGHHSSGKNLFQVADLAVDSHCPLSDASVDTKHEFDKIGPLSTLGFVTMEWMTICTVVELLEQRGVKIYINPSHNAPGDTHSHERLEEALAEYKKRLRLL